MKGNKHRSLSGKISGGQLFGFLLVAAALSLCGTCNTVDDVVFAPDPPGAWYRGDLHVHSTGASNDTGGDSWPSAIAERAQEAGLSFVLLADHSNSTGSDASTTVEDPALFNQGPEFPYWDSAALFSMPGDFLLVQGNEISPVKPSISLINPTGHIGCLPPDLATFDTSTVFTDRPMGAVTGGDALAQARDAGCWSILYHPYAAASWIRYDWRDFGYDAMEVWNGTGGWDEHDERSLAAWRCDLISGRNVVPVGGSDNHRVNIAPPGGGTDPALGYPYTAVFAESLTWPSIVEGLQAGKVAIGEGESFLQLDAYDGEGSLAEGNQIAFLRVRGSVDAGAENPVLELLRITDCADNRTVNQLGPDLTKEVLLPVEPEPGESFDLVQPIAPQPGVYHAIMRSDNGHYGALSRAIVIP